MNGRVPCPEHAVVTDLAPRSVPVLTCERCGHRYLDPDTLGPLRRETRARVPSKRMFFGLVSLPDRMCALCGNERVRLTGDSWACVACGEPYVPLAASRGVEVEAPDDAEAKLRRAIADEPDDDVPRDALADLLLERGDPRGEFMRLQLEEARLGPNWARAERINELLTRHVLEWVPRGVDASKCEFRRGLLWRAPWTPSTSPLHEGWATVEVLDVSTRGLEVGAREHSPLGGPRRRALRRIGRLGPVTLGWLLEAPPPRLASLGLLLRTARWTPALTAELEALLARFPLLEELDLEEEHTGNSQHGPSAEELIERLGPRLTRLWLPLTMGVVAPELLARLRSRAPRLTLCLGTHDWGFGRREWLELDAASARIVHQPDSLPNVLQPLQALLATL